MASETKQRCDESIKVAVRISPMAKNSVGTQVIFKKDLTVAFKKSENSKEETFKFDAVYDRETSQTALYSKAKEELLVPFLDGYNALVMAYGQTGSGKSYTMGTEKTEEKDDLKQKANTEEDMGLIPRFIIDSFANFGASSKAKVGFSLVVSFLEVYNDKLYDLLVDSKNPIALHATCHRPGEEVTISKLKEREVGTAKAALDLLKFGVNRRKTSDTSKNKSSSKSHAIFILKLKTTTQSSASETSQCKVMESKFTFVDLAGSESLKKSETKKGETAAIDSSLAALTMVTNALSNNDQDVPYSDSMLTTVLQDSLGGQTKGWLVACLNPAEYNESKKTCTFATQTGLVKIDPRQNVYTALSDSAKMNIMHLRLIELERPDVFKKWCGSMNVLDTSESRFYLKNLFDLYNSTSPEPKNENAPKALSSEPAISDSDVNVARGLPDTMKSPVEFFGDQENDAASIKAYRKNDVVDVTSASRAACNDGDAEVHEGAVGKIKSPHELRGIHDSGEIIDANLSNDASAFCASQSEESLIFKLWKEVMDQLVELKKSQEKVEKFVEGKVGNSNDWEFDILPPERIENLYGLQSSIYDFNRFGMAMLQLAEQSYQDELKEDFVYWLDAQIYEKQKEQIRNHKLSETDDKLNSATILNLFFDQLKLELHRGKLIYEELNSFMGKHRAAETRAFDLLEWANITSQDNPNVTQREKEPP